MQNEALVQGEERGRLLGASGHIFINVSVYNLVSCVLLFKDTWLIHSFDSLALNSWPTGLQLKPERSLPNTLYISSLRHIVASFYVSTQHFSTMPGGHFKEQKHQKESTKVKKRKKRLRSRLHRGHWFTG